MKAIFFDANGVLYRRAPGERHLFAFFESQRLPAPTLERLRQIREEIRRHHPAANRVEQFTTLLTALGVTDPAQCLAGQEALAQDAADITLFPGVVETLETLHQRQFLLGIITNTTASTADKLQWFRTCGLDMAWDAFVFSCEVGVAKPDPRIYQLALNQCAITSEEAVFVGHDAVELMGAREAGLKTVAFACDADAQADVYIQQFGDLLNLTYTQNAQDQAAEV